jgi:hypothetical protein
MESEPIYLHPGTYSLTGDPVERQIQRLEGHIERLQALVGAELQATLAAIGTTMEHDATALISFTGAFTGLSTLLHFCSFTRAAIALERGMETRADQNLAAKLRGLLVPIVDSQCAILGAAMSAQMGVKADSLVRWYRDALAEVNAIKACIGRLT